LQHNNPFGNVSWSFEDINFIHLQGQSPPFDCGQEEQNLYLQHHAVIDQKLGASVTYLLLLHAEFAGFISLTMDEIPLYVHERTEQVKYARMPAVKAAQLAVQSKFKGQKLGQVLINFAILRAQELSKEIGCRFITVDAKSICNLGMNSKASELIS
jgi:GNAT superfamily N-acetyltransferase